MSFKDSISYSKNLITGSIVQKTKQKIVVPFKGIATIKLYDDLTGKQTYEAKSENRITAILSNLAFLDGYYYPMLENEQNNLLNNIFTTYPFRTISLTTGDIPEDPYDYWTWGNLIGYADGWYTYSGDSNLKGTLNKKESTLDKDTHTRHFVFDFPTHAANGTFKSIYWTGGKENYRSAQPPKLNSTYKKRTIKSNNSYSDYNLCTDEKNLYCLSIDKTKLECYDKFSVLPKENITLPVESKAISCDNKNFWILLDDGSFKKLDKHFKVISDFKKSPAVEQNLIKDIKYFDIAVTQSNVYITYRGCTSKSGNNSDYKTYIAMYDKDGTFVKRSVIHNNDYSRAFITEIPNNKLYVMVNDKFVLQLDSDLNVYGQTDLTPLKYYSIVWDKYTQTLFTYSSKKIEEYFIVPAAAHTLLPEPVTKTPINTMKIQYDFTCDYIYPLEMPPH